MVSGSRGRLTLWGFCSLMQHAATLFDGRKRLIKPHLSTKNERILPANGDPCKSPVCVQSFIEVFPLLAGKWGLIRRFNL